MIEIKICSQFVSSLEDTCVHKSSNLTLTLHMSSSFEVCPSICIFCPWECLLCTLIFSSLPSMSMLHHMSMKDSPSLISPTYRSFGVSVKGWSTLEWWSNVLSRHLLILSEHLIVSDCGDLSSIPISSVCQFSIWSTEPIKYSSTHWQLGWQKPIWLDLPLLQLLVRVRREYGMLSHDKQCCDTGTIEAAIIVLGIELGGNRHQYQVWNTQSQHCLNQVVVLVTTVQIVLSNYYGTWNESITNGHLLFVMGALILQRAQKCEVRQVTKDVVKSEV